MGSIKVGKSPMYPSIVNHIRAIIAGAPSKIPLYIHTVSLNNISCTFCNDEGTIEGALVGYCFAKRMRNLMCTNVQICDAWLKKNSTPL